MPSSRLDLLLVNKGLISTRQKAQRLILAGKVLVNNNIKDKCGILVDNDSNIKIEEEERYVSRGGIKLEAALSYFNINLTGKKALDAGASTGGFTDCLLQKGVLKVFSIDVGYGQLAWKLRNDLRITVIERTNIRYLQNSKLGEQVDIAVLDLSFISLKLVLTNIFNLLTDKGEVVALIKPQFEVGKGEVGKGGVVRDQDKHKDVIKKISNFAEKTGFINSGIVKSPIKGPKGNIEYFIHLKKNT